MLHGIGLGINVRQFMGNITPAFTVLFISDSREERGSISKKHTEGTKLRDRSPSLPFFLLWAVNQVSLSPSTLEIHREGREWETNIKI